MARLLEKILREEEGQNMIEYALLGGLLSIVGIAAVQVIGPIIQGIFEDIQAALGG